MMILPANSAILLISTTLDPVGLDSRDARVLKYRFLITRGLIELEENRGDRHRLWAVPTPKGIALVEKWMGDL